MPIFIVISVIIVSIIEYKVPLKVHRYQNKDFVEIINLRKHNLLYLLTYLPIHLFTQLALLLSVTHLFMHCLYFYIVTRS